jgi:hypothetical protein
VTDSKIKPVEKLSVFEETEPEKKVETLNSRDHAEHNDNQSVKLAMAEELIEMGISKASAHRLLNIRQP